jgi:hypothetical protein
VRPASRVSPVAVCARLKRAPSHGLAAQPIEFFAFVGGQAVAAQTLIGRCLLDPFPDRIGSKLELARQVVHLPPASPTRRFAAGTPGNW